MNIVTHISCIELVMQTKFCTQSELICWKTEQDVSQDALTWGPVSKLERGIPEHSQNIILIFIYDILINVPFSPLTGYPV